MKTEYHGTYQHTSINPELGRFLCGTLSLRFEPISSDPVSESLRGSIVLDSGQDTKPLLSILGTYSDFLRRAKELGFPEPGKNAMEVSCSFMPVHMAHLLNLQCSSVLDEPLLS